MAAGDSQAAATEAGLVAEFFSAGTKGGEEPAAEPGPFALGQFTDTAPPKFRLAAFTDVEQLAPYAETDVAAMRWSGMLAVPDSGQHVLSAEMSFSDYSSAWSCTFSWSLGKASVIKISAVQPKSSHQFGKHRLTEHTAVALESGQHAIDLWLACAPRSSARVVDVSTVTVTLMWRPPGASVLGPVPSSAFVHARN